MIQYFKVLEVNDRGKANKDTGKKLNKANTNHSSRRHQGRESSDEDTGKNSKKASSTTVPVRTSQRTNPTGTVNGVRITNRQATILLNVVQRPKVLKTNRKFIILNQE